MTVNEFLIYWTLAVAAALVLALAFYLSAVAYFLHKAGGGSRSHLAKLADGLGAVRDNVAPLRRRLTTVASALASLREELRQVEDRLSEPPATSGY